LELKIATDFRTPLQLKPAEVAQLGERKTEVLEAASSILALGKIRTR
jgi:hypothetical protein